MQLIDTHCHIYEPEFDVDREQAVLRAREAGVTALLMPDIDSSSRDRMLDLSSRYPGFCRPMAGLHPTSVNANPRWRGELAQVEDLLTGPSAHRFCGVGEIGLDFYWDAGFQAEQTEAFRHQIELAIACRLPVAIHTRDAWPAMEEVIRSYAGSGLKGVFHAFSQDAATYRRLTGYGDFLFGIGGIATFRKSPLADVIPYMELRHIVLETDAPYLTPAPHRGKRNEPAYLPFICSKVAELMGLTPDGVAAATTANARRMFGDDD